MIEAAGNQTIANNRRRGFEAVSGFVLPNQPSVRFIETVKISIRGAEINMAFIDGGLARPTRAAPGIFVQASGYALSLKLPNNLQRPFFPGSGTEKVSRRISQPEGNGRWRFWWRRRRFGFGFGGLAAAGRNRQYGSKNEDDGGDFRHDFRPATRLNRLLQ